MAEEFRKPPLQEIPSKPLQRSQDGDADLLNLINSIKESLNVKMLALRKDIDLTVHDRIASEMTNVQGKIQELNESLRADVQGESRQQVSAMLEEIELVQEQLKNKQAGLAESNESLSKGLTSISEKVEGIAAGLAGMVHASDIEPLRREVAANLEKTAALVSKFDLPLFINDIKDAFSAKVLQAETRAKHLASELEVSLEEKSRLEKDLSDARARLDVALQEKERVQKELKETTARLNEELSRFTALMQKKDAELQAVSASLVQEARASPARDAAGSPVPASSPAVAAPADAGNKVARFCYNCGKPRTGASARFCTFCGEHF